MKIKVIDMLVKIANGEEEKNVKTKYDSATWIKDDFLFNIYKEFEKRRNFEIVEFLNDYVEIIEEPKKIEYEQIEELTCNEYDYEKKTINSLIKNQRKLIDEINNLKEKKDE